MAAVLGSGDTRPGLLLTPQAAGPAPRLTRATRPPSALSSARHSWPASVARMSSV